MSEQSVAIHAASQDDKILAALAHGAVIIPTFGMIVSIVIWVTQKDKSPFVRDHALQALAYQIAAILLSLLGVICYFCLFLASMGIVPLGMLVAIPPDITATAEPTLGPGGIVAMLSIFAASFSPFCFMGVFLVAGLLYILYGLYGALCALQGRDFEYIVIGPWLKRYLAEQREV
jgi:uncharacterized Tic20 family protein